MKDIAIYGGGGFGREVACLIHKINEKNSQWNILGFFDDGIKKGTRNEYGEILGGMEELNAYAQELSLAIGIGSPHIVHQVRERITNSKIDFPNIISPDIVYLDEANMRIGKGNIISFGCILSCNVSIGDFNILNWNISIGHDVVIEDFNAFMPSVKISGEVTIGKRNFFGVNSVVLQQLFIGNDTVIGANSLILRKTKDGMTYIGNPAKIINY
jgi:sugar O-acyltransferase (sialic acid O-acetyltransferase NeuD family)